METLYLSPALLGLNLLLACALTSTGLWLFSRPYRGPGWWMVGNWTIALGMLCSLGYNLHPQPWLHILAALLLLAGEAIVLLGVLRFLDRPLPYWLLPTSTLAMLVAEIWYFTSPVDAGLLTALHALIAAGLQLEAARVLWQARHDEGIRGVRRFVIAALLGTSLLQLLRAAQSLQLHPIGDWLPPGTRAEMLQLSLGLPAWLVVINGLTLMTMHRILTDSRRHAHRAEANAQRFVRLMRVASAAKLLIDDGRVSDANPTAERLFGRAREGLLGRAFEKLFDNPARARSLVEQADGRPYDLPALHNDSRRFPAEVRVSRLDDGSQLIAEVRDVSHRRVLEDKLLRLATTDGLTGALNRRAFGVCADHELRRALRHSYPLSLALLDLDHFKHINDQYGHPIGDQVLRQFGQLCRRQMRSTDLFARVGGEEFILLMPDTPLAAAVQFLDRLRQDLQDHVFAGLAEELQVTVSVGISCCTPDSDLESLQKAADEALYRAKDNGRNRVETQPFEPPAQRLEP
ncbi:GGDEF domain-containing protein [Pseudomonas aeruginosa]|uniref:GGDEF domain-containing protein n=1 Tax=Pseudomonas aeruginosa TaxID=287 RepID=UPI0026EB4639|nr:sensor domain-containing diguanylate cyclase [Pseudomonas aeruginosa]